MLLFTHILILQIEIFYLFVEIKFIRNLKKLVNMFIYISKLILVFIIECHFLYILKVLFRAKFLDANVAKV